MVTGKRKDALRNIFLRIVDKEAFSEAELNERMADFVFHMCDFGYELSTFAQCLESIENQDSEKSLTQFYCFFDHALNHLEAARLLALPDHENLVSLGPANMEIVFSAPRLIFGLRSSGSLSAGSKSSPSRILVGTRSTAQPGIDRFCDVPFSSKLVPACRPDLSKMLDGPQLPHDDTSGIPATG